jgi:hypothetical protein
MTQTFRLRELGFCCPGEKEGISHAILNREGATAQADQAHSAGQN